MQKTTTLKSGLKLITAPMRGTKTAAILVMVGTGSKYEKKENNGISHFLEHMFFKGTKKRPDTFNISSALDGIGAEFNAYTSKEYTGYWVKATAEKIELGMDVLSDMLFNSKIEEKEIAREKGVIVEEYNMYLDNPMAHIEDIFEELLYGDTPAGRWTIGPKKNILKFKRKDFIDYLNSQYGARNITIVLAGNISSKEKEIKRKLEKYFSGAILDSRGNNFYEKEKVLEYQSSPQCLMEYKKTDQAYLVLGCRACSFADEKKSAARMISIILGGGMSSRLFLSLRERNGLAYSVHTDCESYTDSGYVATRAGVPIGKIFQAIDIILDEYKKIKTKLVSHAELQRAKDMLSGHVAIQMEESDNMANWFGRQAAMIDATKRTDPKAKNLKLLSPEEHLLEIKKITAKDIQRVAQEIFTPKNLNLAVIGPFKDKKKFEKLLRV
ncbi:MAG: pitrilysin family protein [bacterium]